MRARLGTLLTLLLLALAAAGCGGGTEPAGNAEMASESTAEAAPRAQAERLAKKLLVVDTHVDAPYRWNEEPIDISVAAENRDFDYPRAVEGGLDAPFMSIYVPASYQETGGGKELADTLIGWVESLEAENPEKFAVARSPRDLTENFKAGRISLPMGMENGAPIEELSDLEYFHGRGIRYITLTHSENNQICDSSYAEEKKWGGLSPYGREVVAEMNRVGIMIDVSHVSDQAFDQVMELTRAPVIASHSSCRKFTPGWERNMSDEMIRELARNGGVIQINFGSAFLDEEARAQSTEYWGAVRDHAAKNELESGDPELEAFRGSYWENKEKIYADLSDVIAHIDHVVSLVGVDHVGLGSDFDGVGDSLPTGLKDVSEFPNLIRALLEAGYSEGDVAKIASGNLLRVWREVERVASELQAESAT